ncbi:50S ribosomal protein L24 [Luteipulveratus sp. YIM 133132]|uniref:Large ribosomal subunit protein uL24 n=1 Tax=Luteipulveratus flavus TaxID=3031728 RepID=A0ABT6C8L4_9MICO|nr:MULTISPECIES: 50S ribosomal protein L24 [unclassified Luteipulveratus]MDE9365264.1 50S ribosomal protein L24 [Luteipulveratus sp. YIM 133132]MDF8264399.1 50S ribosomal protein L24 [Luteipulveratus sp. YIM 133296]
MAGKMKIKKNDLVQVITGRSQDKGGDKGKQGKVIAVYPETQRVLVEGINRVTKHVKAGQPGQSSSGGIEVVEAPIHVSNVAVVDPETGKPSRIKTRVETVERDGRTKTVRTRVAVRSGKDL